MGPVVGNCFPLPLPPGRAALDTAPPAPSILARSRSENPPPSSSVTKPHFVDLVLRSRLACCRITVFLTRPPSDRQCAALNFLSDILLPPHYIGSSKRGFHMAHLVARLFLLSMRALSRSTLLRDTRLRGYWYPIGSTRPILFPLPQRDDAFDPKYPRFAIWK